MTLFHRQPAAFSVLFLLLVLFCLALVPAGGWALLDAPDIGASVFCQDGMVWTTPRDLLSPPPQSFAPPDALVRIAGTAVTPADLLAYPEFFRRAEEERWWSRQRDFYQTLKQNRVELTLMNQGDPRQVSVQPGTLDGRTVMRRSAFLYFTVAVYLLMALYVFFDSTLPAGRPCSLLLVSIAIYFASMTPLHTRDVALHPLATRLFVVSAFVGVAGFPAIAHFAWLFPVKKRVLSAHPALEAVPYIYGIAVLALYLTRITAYGSAFPFLILWILIILASFAHSIASAPNGMIRQIAILGTAPLTLILLYFLGLVVIPNIQRSPILDYSLLGAFSLCLPFALPFAMKSLRLYQEKEERDRHFLHEKHRITQELHDNLGNDLATLRLIGEQFEPSLLNDAPRFEHLKNLLLNTVQRDIRHVSDFVWAISPDELFRPSLLERLQAFADDIAPALGIAIEIHSPHPEISTMDTFQRYHLYCMAKEALTNAVKHAAPRHVRISLASQTNRLELSIEDDGIGLPSPRRDGRGILNLHKRAAQIGARLSIQSAPGQGTRIHITMPFTPSPLRRPGS
ncbi:MAG: hypothetical protein GX548_10125 [Lentisphaerae bacterium]|nr:hypothetical protein [Lentisphaerota bacterium]